MQKLKTILARLSDTDERLTAHRKRSLGDVDLDLFQGKVEEKKREVERKETGLPIKAEKVAQREQANPKMVEMIHELIRRFDNLEGAMQSRMEGPRNGLGVRRQGARDRGNNIGNLQPPGAHLNQRFGNAPRLNNNGLC